MFRFARSYRQQSKRACPKEKRKCEYFEGIVRVFIYVQVTGEAIVVSYKRGYRFLVASSMSCTVK
jgi:hypothetical protein